LDETPETFSLHLSKNKQLNETTTNIIKMENTELNWKTWLERGKQYLMAATPKKEKSVFNADIRYNLLSMSLESYVMAMLDFNHTLPENHTYTDLVTALDAVIPMDVDLKNRILKYENIQSICSIDKYHTVSPTEEELVDLKGAIEEIEKMAMSICGKEA
jgi:hypothetical protein